MGRRSKSDELGLNQRIVDMHDRDKLSHREISSSFEEEGIEISREAVRRSYRNSARKAEKYRLASDSCRQILETVKDGSSMDMVEAINGILTGMFYDKILDMEDIDFQKPEDFIKAIKSVGETQVKVSQYRLNFNRGVEKAKKAIYDALALQLAEKPELLSELGKVIQDVEVKE